MPNFLGILAMFTSQPLHRNTPSGSQRSDRCATDRQQAHQRERLARKVARAMNSYVVPDVPPFTRRELLIVLLGTLVIGAVLSLLFLGAALPPTGH
jgi:hypothetical protein